MRFRPCIDIHNGKVKQIVGSSINDSNQSIITNFESNLTAADFAKLYKQHNVLGGHIIILDESKSPLYLVSKAEAIKALQLYPNGLQIGGGITIDTAKEFLDYGASHIILTSYLFEDGKFQVKKIQKLVDLVGKERIVIDLSCRNKQNEYYVVMNRWQTFTNLKVNHNTLSDLSEYCDEFLIHGVDVEGKKQGIEKELVQLLADFDQIPITYAGGIGSIGDLMYFQELSSNKLNYTIGSGLDLFGGTIPFANLVI